MKHLKKTMVIILVLSIVVGMVPFSELRVSAGIATQTFGTVKAGQTATVTCYGTTLYSQTNLCLSSDGKAIGKVTGYDKNGKVFLEEDVCGNYFEGASTSMLTGGTTIVVEVYYGVIEIGGNYTSSVAPSVEIEDNNKELDPMIKSNISHVYLTVGDTASYGISWIAPGYYAEVYEDYNYYPYTDGYSTSDSSVAKVGSDGTITAVGVGKATITMAYKFGISSTKWFAVAHTCEITVLADYGIKEAYENYYAEGNDKYFNIVVLNDGEERTTGFDIQVGEDVYNTGDDYQMMITFPDGYDGDVVISKDGFIPYTLENKHISSYNWVTLYPENDGLPIVQSVLGHQTFDTEWYNLKVRSLNVYEESKEKYQIDVNINWGSKKKNEVWIQQGDIILPVNNGTTGEIALGEYFVNNGEPVYVCAKTADGITVKSQILINIYSPDKYAYLDFGDEGGLEATYTGDADALHGMPFTFKLSGNIPFEYSVDEDGKVRGTLGIQTTLYENKYTYYDEIKETIQSLKGFGEEPKHTARSKEIQNLLDTIKNDGGEVVTSKSSFAIGCDVTFLGYVEGYMVNGKLDVSEIGMVCNLSGSVTMSQQSLAFVVPHYWEVKITAELEVPIAAVNKNETGRYQVTIPEVEFKVKFSGTIAAGLEKIAGVGVRLNADLIVSVPPDSEGLSDTTWTLNIGFEQVVQILNMEYTEAFWDDVVNWQLYPYEDPEMGEILMALTDEANFTQTARMSLLSDSSFREGVIETDSENYLTVEAIETNAYTDSKPQMVHINGKNLLVWLEDDLERSDENRTCLYYSVYDESTELWSEPLALLNDGKADFNPVLKKIEGKVYLLWQKASEVYEEGATLSEIASKLDIYYSEFNTENNTFSTPINISGENDVYDANPTIINANGQTVIVWSQNSDSDIFGASGTNSICSATLSDGSWAITVLASSLKTISGLAACEVDGDFVVYYAADTDEEYTTSNDIEIFAIQSGSVTQVTDNDYIDALPQVTNGKLYWYADGKITDGSQNISYSSDEAKYSVIGSEEGNIQAVLYTVCSDMTNNVYATINDGNGWGEPVQITAFDDCYITDFDGYFEGGELVIVANCRDVDDERELGTATIVKCTKTLFGDLSISDASHKVYSLVKDGVLYGSAKVTNNGTSTAKQFTITVSDKSGNVISVNEVAKMLLPGESTTAEFFCNVSDIPDDGIVLSVSSIDFDDSNMENNKVELEINKYDISIENTFAEMNSSGETMVTAFVVNRGLEPLSNVELTFLKDSMYGEPLGTVMVDTIDVGGSSLVTFKTTEVSENSIIYVYATELDKENIYSNNIDFACAYSYSKKFIAEDIIEFPKSITENTVELDYTYYVSGGDEDESITTTFIPDETGFYKIQLMQYDFESYPYSDNVSVFVENLAPHDKYSYRIEEGEKLCSATNYIYYMSAGEEYTVNIDCPAQQAVEVTFSKTPVPEAISLENNTFMFTEGEDAERLFYLETTLSPEYSYGVLNYVSSDETVVTVDSYGRVFPHLPGVAVITVTVEGTDLSAKCYVSVFGIEKTELQADEEYTNLSNGKYSFTPTKTGFYKVTSSDCYMTKYDEMWNILWNTEFCYYEKGKTYYFDIYETFGEGGQCKIEYLPAIEVGDKATVEIATEDQSVYYNFVPDKDGYYAFYSISNADTCGYIYDSENQLAYNDDGGDGNNFKMKHKLESGKAYLLQACYYNSSATGSFDVCVEEIRYVTSLEITSLPTKMDYIKGFAEDYLDYDGLKLKATWSDGTVSEWTARVDGNYIEDERVYFDTDAADDSGVITINCCGQEVSFTLNLIDNPVESIEVIKGTSEKYLENDNGYITNRFNEETEKYEEYFYYYTNKPSDAVIRINYVDGTSTTGQVGDYVNGYWISWDSNQDKTPWVVGTDNVSIVSYLGKTVTLPITVEENKIAGIEIVSGAVTPCIENTYGYTSRRYDTEIGEMVEYYHYYYDVPDDIVVKINYTDGTSTTANIRDSVDGYYFSCVSDQYNNPWVLGNENYITVSYRDVSTQIPVSVISSPVDCITINSAPTREYVYGDTEYGWFYSNGDYEFFPTDLTGLSFTVYYTDDTSETYTYTDIDDNGKINGYGYELYYNGYEPDIGNIPVSFSYMGKSAEYSVVLKEAEVASIEVIKNPTTVNYSNDYYPNFEGLELKITYTDGKSKIVTVTEDNLSYNYSPQYDEITYEIGVDGDSVIIEPHYTQDGIYYTVTYFGKSCEIRDITFTEDAEITTIELDNVSWNGDGMNIKVTYEDETTETMVMDVVTYYDFGDSSTVGFGKTDNGLLYYCIETYMDNNKVERYKVEIFGQVIEVFPQTVLVGDVNGDGNVNGLDRVMLTRYLAKWTDYPADIIDMSAADVNCDGLVNGLDRLILTRYLAKWSEYTELPYIN